MKIGFVLDDTLDSTDGVQQYVLGLGGWLSGQGHQVHYLVGQTTRQDLADIQSLSRNIGVRFNGNRMSIPLPASRRRIKALLVQQQFDVLHVQMPYSPWLAQRIILAAPARTAIIGTFHIAPHSGLVRFATRALAVWTRRSLARFDTVVSVSTAAADFARLTYKLETAIVPNVVETRRFATAQPLARFQNKPTIMFLGRLVPRKGCQLLLEAATCLHRLAPELAFQVVICGRGPLLTELKEYVSNHRLAGTVEFAGYVSEADKPAYLKSADLAVFPSSGGESFGIVLLEAMAAGHPVVLGADNPGYAAVLAPYPSSLFPTGDAQYLATKLQMLLTNVAARQEALDWQAAYLPQFDIAIIGAKLIELYHAAVYKRAGS